ncbi:MAG: serine hydrolase domain-containing protein, partial [Ilumatobacteraceae bacterium]
DTGTPMSPDATFRIASLTKPFTAGVVMQLVAEDTLGLDDTVEQWLPGIVTDADLITIRQLLGHTSGIADYFTDPAVIEPYLEGDYEYVWTPQQLVEIAEQLGATSEPGTEWSYSNTNYAILGLIVEQATGHTLGGEMQTRIFDELDLRNTTFATDTSLDPQMAHGYLLSDDDPIDVTGVYPFPYGAGNIVSDAADTATFYGALFGGEVVEPALLDEMKPIVADDVVPYGLGVMAWEMPCGVAYGHDGGFAGYSTRSLVLDDGRQVVILANSITIDDHVAADHAADAQYMAIIDSAMCD